VIDQIAAPYAGGKIFPLGEKHFIGVARA